MGEAGEAVRSLGSLLSLSLAVSSEDLRLSSVYFLVMIFFFV